MNALPILLALSAYAWGSAPTGREVFRSYTNGINRTFQQTKKRNHAKIKKKIANKSKKKNRK